VLRFRVGATIDASAAGMAAAHGGAWERTTCPTVGRAGTGAKARLALEAPRVAAGNTYGDVSASRMNPSPSPATVRNPRSHLRIDVPRHLTGIILTMNSRSLISGTIVIAPAG